MKSILIGEILPPVDIFGSENPGNLNLLVSGFTGSTYNIGIIPDSAITYTVKIVKEDCEPLIRTFPFTVTPTPTPTVTHTPTPTVSPSISITWLPFTQSCETILSCPDNHTLSSDKSYCYGFLTSTATPPSSNTIGYVDNRRNGAYSNFGAKIYKPDGYNPDGTATINPSIVTTTPLWANPTSNLSHGRLNNVGIWAVDDCSHNNYLPVSDQYIGFSKKIEILSTKTYYIGIAGDNQARIRINGVPIVELKYPPADPSNFKYWHIYPVVLKEGPNYVELAGKDDGSVSASFGAEIYDNTELEIINATDENQLNIVFSTGNMFCEPLDIGETYGYSCPSSYTLDTSLTGTPTCVKRVEVEPYKTNTGYQLTKYRKRVFNGVEDGFIEENLLNVGLGPYFPPVPFLNGCPVGIINPTPTPSSTSKVTPTVTPTITLTPTPSRSVLTSFCSVTIVNGQIDVVSAESIGDGLTIRIQGMDGGYYNMSSVAMIVSSSNCRPCITVSGSVEFVRRDGYIEIMNYTITPTGRISFEGYLPTGDVYDTYFLIARNCEEDSLCMVKGTMITTASGTQVPIETLSPSDLLMSLDIEGLDKMNESNHYLSSWRVSDFKGNPDVSRVKNIKRSVTTKVIDINNQLRSTLNHRHLIVRNNIYQFEEAQNIKNGDMLLTHDGTLVVVQSKQVLNGYFEIYKLDVEDNDLFFANGILTHNVKL